MTLTTEDLEDQIKSAPVHQMASEPKSGNGVAELPAAVPLDGAVVLEEVRNALVRYVVLPSPEAADAITCWIVATHAQLAWEHATRLIIKSPLKRCGKTRLLEVISELVHRPLRTVNISSAALVRSIDAADPPTIILDEGDTIFTKRRGEASEQAEAIRGILNSGHSKGWPYIRWNAAAREAEECETYADGGDRRHRRSPRHDRGSRRRRRDEAARGGGTRRAIPPRASDP